MNDFVGLTLSKHMTIIALHNSKLKHIIQLAEVISLERVHSSVRLPSPLY